MTYEQQKAKELAELLIAFSEGKQLEYNFYPENEWRKIEDVESIIIAIKAGYEIRIKPETKREPLNQQDLIERRKLGFEAMWVKNSKGDEYFINGITDGGIHFGKAYLLYEELLESNLTFLDGTPCYKEVDCE